ncbi:hypothetical protein [Spirochaeta dissipatitropha]
MNQSDNEVADIIGITEPESWLLHVSRWNGQHHPLDVYVRDPAEWFSWNRWRNEHDDATRNHILSLIDVYREPDTWLLAGIYRILNRKPAGREIRYEIAAEPIHTSYPGRLKIRMPRPPRGSFFRLEQNLGDMRVSEM